jgi:DNA-binding YbaB/EbfC family protein
MSDAFDLEAVLQQAMALQQRVAEAQEAARNTTVEGTSGGGIVRITLNGAFHPHAVSISPEAVDPDDLTLLEDLVLAALRDAVDKVQALAADTVGEIDLGGFGGLLGSG